MQYFKAENTHIPLFSTLETFLEYLGSTQTRPDTNYAIGSSLLATTRRDYHYCKTVCQRSGHRMIIRKYIDTLLSLPRTYKIYPDLPD